MGNVHSQNSDYVVWVLKSEFANSLRLTQEPDGWDDEDYQLDRHKSYHGIFTSFTNSLTFRKDAIDYINLAYQIGGINTNLYLTRYKLRDIDGEIKYVQDYFGLADYSTKVEKDNGLEIKFNSNELEELIKSHEADVFEIERMTSIDDDELEILDLFNVKIQGRSISGIGESVVDLEVNKADFFGTIYQKVPIRTKVSSLNYATVITKTISPGAERFNAVTSNEALTEMSTGNMFFDRTDTQEVVEMDVNYAFKGFFSANGGGQSGTVRAAIVIHEWDGVNWFEVSSQIVKSWTWNAASAYRFDFDFQGTQNIKDLLYNQGVAIVFYISNPGNGTFPYGDMYFSEHNTRVATSDFYEASSNLKFAFVHDCINRLMYILTGEQDRFYSRYFGRTELGYNLDGIGGLIGMISGFWVRAFDPSSKRYKSLQISLKDALESVQAVFNIGIGVESHNLKQRLRTEELEYFYQNEVVIRLPFQVSNVERSVDKDLFFSGTEFGYQYGGEYESQVGLDEPNTRTKSVTPIRKSKLKYRKVSKVRSDETGMELTRRKPQAQFPEEDTSQDEHNWFLDLKRSDTIGYEQNGWEDRLEEIPSGVSIPDNYRSMFFTPLRMMFRHGFVLRSGLEPYYNKPIKYASSAANSELTTWTKGEAKAYKENEDILVADLDRARFLPEEIKLNHPVSDDLMDNILGSTKTFYKGEYENIPNIYFKFEWLNEYGEYETGYLLNLKPKGDGEFTFQKANENILKQI